MYCELIENNTKNIPIQTLIFSPRLSFRKIIISQLELGPMSLSPSLSFTLVSETGNQFAHCCLETWLLLEVDASDLYRKRLI